MKNNNKTYADIGVRLAWVRCHLANKQNQYEFAKFFNWEPKTYNTWETGERRITIPHAVRLCETYDLSLDFIYRGKTSVLPVNIANLYLENQRTKK